MQIVVKNIAESPHAYFHVNIFVVETNLNAVCLSCKRPHHRSACESKTCVNVHESYPTQKRYAKVTTANLNSKKAQSTKRANAKTGRLRLRSG
jgi:hypothetical protein